MIAGCSGDMLVDDFVELVAGRARVPAACFYLVGAGSKALRLRTSLCDAWVGHALLFMTGRLRGGFSRPRPPPVPGSWHCYVCDMGGAGQRGTRVFGVARRGLLCFSRNLALSLRVKISFRGVPPQPSGGGNPTYRNPAPQVASVPPTGGRSCSGERRCVGVG